MRKKTFIIHPFLLSIYPVLFLYSHNIGQIAFRDIFVPIAIIAGCALPVWCIFGFILKSFKKSGIIVSSFLILFFSYGYFRSFLGAKAHAPTLISVWIGLFIISSFFVIRNKNTFHTTTMVLNVISSVLIIFPIVNITIHQFNNTGLTIRNSGPEIAQVPDDLVNRTDYQPDIYFIILDAYARRDILRDMYDYDNSEFISFLRGKGFFVADKSISNYCQTGLVVGSCLNLSYLDEFVEKVGQYGLSRRPLEALTNKSYAVKYLKQQGYGFITFKTNRPELQFPDADIHLEAGITIEPFKNALKNLTPLPDILTTPKSNDPFELHRRNTLSIFDGLTDIYKLTPKPKFVFAHIEVPHPPFVFDRNGKPVCFESRYNDHDGDWLIRPGRMTREQYRKRYVDQVIFVNGQMEKVVSKILANSPTPPVILILGDHGPRSEMFWSNPKKTNMKECFANLGAYYLPGGGTEKLYPEISLVNILRVTFDHYFHTKFRTLPDKCYFSTAKHLYKFYDVTEDVRKE